jgi:hypothetical protein
MNARALFAFVAVVSIVTALPAAKVEKETKNDRKSKMLFSLGNDMGVNLPAIQLLPGLKYFTDKTSWLLPIISSPAPVPIVAGVIVAVGAVALVLAISITLGTMFVGIGRKDEVEFDEQVDSNPYKNNLTPFPPFADDDSAYNEQNQNNIGGTAYPSGYGKYQYDTREKFKRYEKNK